MSDEEVLHTYTRIAPPDLSCPRCDNLLPSGLGELTCKMCDAEVKVEHEGTRRKWKEERIGCPECSKVLICGVDKRPANLKCSACETSFEVRAIKVKVEIECPSCNRQLRLNKTPGMRKITCPACEIEFKISF